MVEDKLGTNWARATYNRNTNVCFIIVITITLSCLLYSMNLNTRIDVLMHKPAHISTYSNLYMNKTKSYKIWMHATGAMGNAMFHAAALYGLSRRLGRSPYYIPTGNCHVHCQFEKLFPNLKNYMHLFTSGSSISA